MKYSLIKLTAILALAGLISMGCQDVTNSEMEQQPELQSGVYNSDAFLSHSSTLDPFTQTELDDNWAPDRQAPSGGVLSVDQFGRTNVAQIGIVSSEANTIAGGYYLTEGIKSPFGPADNFDNGANYGESVQIDLYVDPAWQDNSVRAGFWTIGDDGAGEANLGFFGIVEFANVEGVHEGWRAWDSSAGWNLLETDFAYGEWVTLTIELDPDADEFIYYIDGEMVGAGAAGAESTFIRNLILNHKNFGSETGLTDLDNKDYAAHWHAGVVNPQTKNECKKGGWESFGFKNQGQCIRFVNTGKDSR